MADSDGAAWRSIRGDFEGLPAADWSLIWSSRPPVWIAAPVQLASQWTWFRPTDASLRTRASAIFLKSAKARGYGSGDEWLDELRYAEFVRFQLTGTRTDSMPDGTFVHNESGLLKNAVSHSITLCHQLEAGCAPKPIIGRLPKEAKARIDTATVSFMADFAPKLEQEWNKVGLIRAAELIRELVLHQFNFAARECMELYPSAEEFEAELRAGIAQFVKFNLSQLRWLADSSEVSMGFTFFVLKANPWAGVPESERASGWHVGAVTGEALSDAAMKLIAEATTRATNKQPAAVLIAAQNNAASAPPFPKRALWLTAKLKEREWSKHDLQKHGGPEHRTSQKILDGFNVQDDVLRRVILGLSSKTTHSGRSLPPVTESEIPKD